MQIVLQVKFPANWQTSQIMRVLWELSRMGRGQTIKFDFLMDIQLFFLSKHTSFQPLANFQSF